MNNSNAANDKTERMGDLGECWMIKYWQVAKVRNRMQVDLCIFANLLIMGVKVTSIGHYIYILKFITVKLWLKCASIETKYSWVHKLGDTYYCVFFSYARLWHLYYQCQIGKFWLWTIWLRLWTLFVIYAYVFVDKQSRRDNKKTAYK